MRQRVKLLKPRGWVEGMAERRAWVGLMGVEIQVTTGFIWLESVVSPLYEVRDVLENIRLLFRSNGPLGHIYGKSQCHHQASSKPKIWNSYGIYTLYCHTN